MDITAGLAGRHLSAALGQPVVIDNRPGAGGTLAAKLLRDAEADGYTLMMGANGEMAISPKLRPNLAYEPLRDFATISRVGASQLVPVVPSQLPAKSVADLIALSESEAWRDQLRIVRHGLHGAPGIETPKPGMSTGCLQIVSGICRASSRARRCGIVITRSVALTTCGIDKCGMETATCRAISVDKQTVQVSGGTAGLHRK